MRNQPNNDNLFTTYPHEFSRRFSHGNFDMRGLTDKFAVLPRGDRFTNTEMNTDFPTNAPLCAYEPVHFGLGVPRRCSGANLFHPMGNSKQCTGCFEIKPLAEYTAQKTGKFGVTSKCRLCSREISRAYSKENREKCAAKVNRWRAANREKVRAGDKIYYANTREKRVESTIKWQKKNPGNKLASGSSYRAKNKDALKEWRHKNRGLVYSLNRKRDDLKSNATPAWLTESERECIKTIYKMSARISACTGIKHHVDHIHPLKSKDVCGLHVPWNLRAIPAKINLRKGHSVERGCY